jgi:hypothetical protein
MKKSIILVSMLSVIEMGLVSCASESKTATTTTRQATMTVERLPRIVQPNGYRDWTLQRGDAPTSMGFW